MTFAEPEFALQEHALDERTHVISVSGEIHLSTAEDFNRLLEAALDLRRTAVVVDLADVVFIDSTGLSILLNGLRRVTRQGGRMALVCANPTVLRLFEVTRLDATFDIHAQLDDALRAVQDEP